MPASGDKIVKPKVVIQPHSDSGRQGSAYARPQFPAPVQFPVLHSSNCDQSNQSLGALEIDHHSNTAETVENASLQLGFGIQ